NRPSTAAPRRAPGRKRRPRRGSAPRRCSVSAWRRANGRRNGWDCSLQLSSVFTFPCPPNCTTRFVAGRGCDRPPDEGGHSPVCHFQLGGTVTFRREDFRRCFPGNLRLRLTRRTAGRYPVLWDRHTSLTKGAEYGREKSHQRTEQSRRL